MMAVREALAADGAVFETALHRRTYLPSGEAEAIIPKRAPVVQLSGFIA